MRRRRRGHNPGHERWLVSYADFITLLFAFFVVLYASSRADQKKQAQISQAIHSAFQVLGLFPASSSKTPDGKATKTPDQSVMPVNIILGDDLAASPRALEDFERIRRKLADRLSNQIATHIVALRIGREGLVISLREAGFYDSGSAVPHRSSQSSLDQIAEVLAASPWDIRIEGHTDNVPIHTAQFDSNWELSTARASELARFFILRHTIAPQRLSASGYAEFHPVASNATPEGRAVNRRVDIIVLPRISGTPSASPATQTQTQPQPPVQPQTQAQAQAVSQLAHLPSAPLPAHDSPRRNQP
ncbi:flagellar motor protein MotB [Paracidobacterium acidisoli]|uniref:Flagellar motor protein n=1 Tax=Paracidobacterium acidisoli TaxID=2303751 RepID=A0A372IU94_9BACT|nr:flagellar motor protein MotB [Paracidobacterium acidisoli]MBT9329964.1 OmpA family protein [Paracidobacterium acidisoli]